MRDAQGRQFVWEELLDGGALFRDCRVYTDAGCIDIGSSQIAYAEGARARVTWTRLWDECASAVGLMVSEAAARSEAKKAHQ